MDPSNFTKATADFHVTRLFFDGVQADHDEAGFMTEQHTCGCGEWACVVFGEEWFCLSCWLIEWRMTAAVMDFAVQQEIERAFWDCRHEP